MTFDFPSHKSALVREYADLAAEPGWRAYVRARLSSMAEREPELWGDMLALVEKAVNEQGAGT